MMPPLYSSGASAARAEAAVREQGGVDDAAGDEEHLRGQHDAREVRGHRLSGGSKRGNCSAISGSAHHHNNAVAATATRRERAEHRGQECAPPPRHRVRDASVERQNAMDSAPPASRWLSRSGI